MTSASHQARGSLARTGGLVLAGGRSRRFGAEKAAALFRGRPMMDAVVDRLSCCAALAVSARANCAAARRASAMGLDVLLDDPAHPPGPLAGVCAGLAWAKERGLELLGIAPCDAPELPHDVFMRLIASVGAASSAFAVTSTGAHPLCAVWRVELEAPLRAMLEAGLHPAVRAFLAEHGARAVAFEDALAFANANTSADLAFLEGRA